MSGIVGSLLLAHAAAQPLLFDNAALEQYERDRLAFERHERARVHEHSQTKFGSSPFPPSPLPTSRSGPRADVLRRRSASDVVPLIIDTDLGFDVDDVGAIAVANHLQDVGKCRILAIIHNTGFYKGIGGADVINRYYGLSANSSEVALGAYKGAWGSAPDAQSAQDRYTSTLLQNYPSRVQNYDQVQSAVDAYTKVLRAAANGSVVIASIGELTNLRDLLKADSDLFHQKVKAVHYMDGSYNFGCGDSKGSGWSPWLGSTEDCDGAAQYVQEHVRHSVLQGYSLNGGDVLCGSRFQDGCGQGPVKDAYQIWTGRGSRPSWDLITVAFAVLGIGSLFSTAHPGVDHVDYYGNEDFDTAAGTAYNELQVWIDGSRGGDVTRQLDDYLCAAPCGGPIGGCADYTLHSGSNCYDGHGARSIDGETPCGVMILHDCLAQCDATAGCEGVVVSNAGGGRVSCYRKAAIAIDSCDYGDAWGFDTWLQESAAGSSAVL